MANQKYLDQDVLAAFHSASKNLTHAAKIVGASRQTVANILQKMGVVTATSKKNKQVHIDRNVLQDFYYEQGMSLTAIGKALGVSATAVADQMSRYQMIRRAASSCPGAKNGSWRGGRVTDKDGYILVHCPDHPNSNKSGYIREHRLVVSQKLGFPLGRNEVVHHIDGNKQNNNPDNLELYNKNSDHLRHELSGRTPQWTPDGLDRMREGASRGTSQSLKTAWTDERREKAKQRTIERVANGEFGGKSWNEDSHRSASEFAKSRNLPRLPDGTFAPQKQPDQD